jgi:XRE family aerobic/anaerobic benzoate catabolism transcriptional regulator
VLAESQTHDDEAELLATIGKRIGDKRKQLKLSRRALSEMSGLSQRYLVQLENGAGNISIGRLFQLAKALNTPIEDLLSATGNAGIAARYAAASDEQQQAVRRILQLDDTRRQRICLIGLRGAGKSTLGRLAADAMALPFRELNSEIESLSAMPVDEMMALYGQEGYRRMEKRAMTQIANDTDTLVLAAAGGVVSDAETFEFLLTHFHTVWLKASPAEHMQRVIDQGDYRPMAGNPDAMQELENILERRESRYARAHHTLDTAGRSRDASLADLQVIIRRLITTADQS